jgi:hypothetical protein
MRLHRTFSLVALTATVLSSLAACMAGDDAETRDEDPTAEESAALVAGRSKPFCDATPSHGSTKSCDQEGLNQLLCNNGTQKPTRVECRKVTPGSGTCNGSWCQNCTIECPPPPPEPKHVEAEIDDAAPGLIE